MSVLRSRSWARSLATVALSACLLLAASGCSRLRPALVKQYVYVTAKQTYLRDRVAAVSNRTATVQNGDKLQVLERGRRFVRVQTEKGEQGWIDEKVVASQDIFDRFEALKKQHENDLTIAAGVVRDDVYLHVSPGRETDKFFRLQENEKLKLLQRATLPKPLPPGTHPAPVAAAPVDKSASGDGKTDAPAAPPPPAMEDWWLVRDSKGDTGWLYSRMMDVDAPDALTRYSEGQRIVGAYVLATVNDPDAPQDDKNIPEYVTVTSPYKAGLTYDFDQVRVFFWNIKKHRYETAYRDRNVAGYLPVKVGNAPDPYGKQPASMAPAPTYSYRVLTDDSAPVVPDPVTGEVKPGKTVLKTYRLEGNLVRRVLKPGETPPGEMRPNPEPEKKKAAALAAKSAKLRKKR